jgi:anti-sigma factor RsiW
VSSGPDLTGSFDGELPEDALSAYLDDELTDDARAAVEARLANSAEWRGILDEVGAARAAVRSLPVVDPPDDFLDRLLAEADPVEASPAAPPTVVDLEQARARRSTRRSRWVAALGGAAAAAVVIAVLVTPSPDRVKPAVGALSKAHAVRTSTGDDSVSTLATIGKMTGFG